VAPAPSRGHPHTPSSAGGRWFHKLYAAIWRLAALRKLGITGYTCACVACQAGASTPKIVNLAIVVCNRLHPVHRLNAVSTPQWMRAKSAITWCRIILFVKSASRISLFDVQCWTFDLPAMLCNQCESNSTTWFTYPCLHQPNGLWVADGCSSFKTTLYSWMQPNGIKIQPVNAYIQAPPPVWTAASLIGKETL